MAISEQPVGTVATPNNLTESSAGSSSTPVNLTESTSGSVDTPANLTESSVGAVTTPVDLSSEPTTNLFSRSEEFNHGDWTGADSAIIANALASPLDPDGAAVAERYNAATTGTNVPDIRQGITTVVGEEYTFSYYLRASTVYNVQIRFGGGQVANNPHVNFAINNNEWGGAIGTVPPDMRNATNTNVGKVGANPFFRISVTVTAATTSLTAYLQLMKTIDDTRAQSNSWTAGQGCYVFGAQAEQGLLTSYFKTTTASATEGAIATPVNLTESSVGSTATPVNLAESGAGSIAVPVNLAEQAVASIPRPLVPLVGMDFTKNRYAQDGGEVAFDDLFTYSRNSNATYWNRRLDQNGKWETFLDTDIVGSVENLQLHSESFDHSDWGKSNLTVIANATNNHFGVKLADEIVEDDYNGTHILSDGNAFTSGSTYAFSVYVKANGRGQVRISAGNLTTFDASSDFDINSGVVLRSLNGHASITYERDGWWRCTVIGLSSSTGTTNVNIYPAIGLNTNYQGDGTSGVYIWGAQLTESAKPLPYIKTTSSTTAQTIVELPRIEYDPVTAEAKGVLIEGANTNVATYSEDFTHSNWIKTSSTISENEHIAPDGTISMDRITPSAVTNGRISHLNITLSTSTEYNLSCYMKNIDSTRSKILLYGSSGAGVKGDLFINWTGGVPSEQQSNNATGISFQDCGNGIWRISATFTSDATVTNHAPYVYPDVDTGTGEIYLWGVQLEKHPHASSYIRTEGVAASRVADNLQASGYGNTNSSIGTLFLEGAPYAATTGTQNVLNINDGTTNNRVVIRATSATNKTNTLVVADGVTEAQFSTADNWDSSQKTVLTYEQDSVVTYIDGLALNTDTSATMPTGITTIDIGQSSASQKQWYGHISSTEIYEEAMTAQEVSLIGSGSIKARTMLSDVMTTPSSSAYSGYKYSLLDYAKIDGSNMTGIDVGDNVTIKMGDGDDLRIYHDGGNSIIRDVGTGDLRVQGANLQLLSSNGKKYLYGVEDAYTKIYYDNAEKLSTTSTGIDVTGNVALSGDITSTDTIDIAANGFGKGVNLKRGNGAKNGLSVASGGDISFYEDTGTTAKFFWDASVERLGIGTDSPSANLEIEGTNVEIDLDNTSGKRYRISSNTDSSFSIDDKDTSTERMRIDSSGRLSFGPDALDMQIDPASTNSGTNLLYMRGNALGDKSEISLNNYGHQNYHIGAGLVGNGKFSIGTSQTDNSFVMDSSGNVLVGKSDSDVDTAGTCLRGSVSSIFTVDGSVDSQVAIFNRKTNDGDILRLLKDGTTVGSIGAEGGDLVVGTGTTGLRFYDASSAVIPRQAGGGASDDTLSLGASTNRFSDLYLSGDATMGGNLLVGKTSTSGGIAGTVLANTGLVRMTASGISVAEINRISSDGSIVDFKRDGTTVGTIGVTGSATSYNTSSDYRLKEDVQPMSGATDRLKELKPVNFAWKSDGSRVDGFLAHEAQEVVPEAVHGTKDGMQTEEYEVSPATGDIYTPAVEAVEGVEAVEYVAPVEAQEAVLGERQVTETVETGSYVNLAGETIVETQEIGVTEESTETVIERQDIDGVSTEVEVERTVSVPVMESYEVSPAVEAVEGVDAVEGVEAVEGVAEVIHSADAEQPSELEDGQLWRETTAAVTGERDVEDYQGIDQSKLVPLLVATIQELEARIASLEA